MKRRPRMFYGWLIVIGAVLVMALSSGTRMSFGVAMVPLSQQFGWTRTTLSTIFLLTGIVTGLLQMTMGVLVDRFGPRRIMGASVILLGIGVWVLSTATTVWQFGLAYGLLVGVGLAGTQQVVGATLVANWFIRHRGFAQSITGSSGALGWMIIVPINLFLERTYDWTMMYRVLGTALLIGAAPLVWWIIRNRPEDMGMQPLGAVPSDNPAATPTPTATPGVPLAQAFRNPKIWKLLYLGFA